MIWREKQLLLVLLGILLLANLIFFFTYRVQYETRLKDFDTRLAESESKLEQARAARINAERQLAAYRKLQRDVQDVYDTRWSTQSARLAPLITEVKRLAVASQLVPESYNFGLLGSKGGTDFGAQTLGITFSVRGTYQQVRRLLNLLELSQQFVIVDQVSLNSAAEGTLTLNLHVKTLFRNPGPDPPKRTANQSL
jgi:hypothetical protein